MSSFCLKEGLEDAWKINIAVVPIGKTSSSKFSFYLGALEQFDQFHLASMSFGATTSSHHTDYIQAFPQADWKTETASLQFLAPSIRGKDNFADWGLSTHRKVLGVIGILDCNHVNDLDDAFNQFQEIPSEFPSALKFRCFAFEPQPHQQDLPVRQNLIMFPNDTQKLHFYLQTTLNDFISFLILDLSLLVRNVDLQPTPLTPFDTPDTITSPKDINPLISPQLPPGTPETSPTALKKDRSSTGRLAKLNGDMALLCGSFRDAIQWYEQALHLMASKDPLWSACALIGMSSAVLKSITEEMEEQSQWDCRSAVVSYLGKAITLLNKDSKLALVQVESILKLARFVSVFESDKVNGFGIVMGMTYLMDGFKRTAYLSAQDQISFCIEASLFCQSLGLRRKSALFQRETALIFCEMLHWSNAIYLLQKASEVYDAFGDGMWLGIQKSVLEEQLFCFKQMGDRSGECRTLCRMIHVVSPYIRQDSQLTLISQLRNYSTLTFSSADLSYFPQLKGCTPIPLESDLRILYKHIQNESSVFLFDPSAHSEFRSEDLKRALRELVLVNVELFNPLAVTLDIQKVRLVPPSDRVESFGCVSPLQTSIGPLASESFLCSFRSDESEIEFTQIEVTSLGHSSIRSLNSPLRFQFVCDIPLLSVSIQFERFVLLEWETCTFHICITNSGRYPVTHLDLSVSDLFASNSVESQNMYYNDCSVSHFTFDSSALTQNLPLFAGDTVSFPMTLSASRICTGGVLSLRYASDSSLSNAIEGPHRMYTETVRFSTVPSLEIVDLDILPITVTATPLEDQRTTEIALLAVQVSNWTDLTFSMICFMGQTQSNTVRIGKQRTQKLTMRIEKDSFTLTDSEILQLLSNCDEHSAVYAKFSQSFSERFKLQFTTEDEREGSLPLPDGILTPEMVRSVVKALVSVSVVFPSMYKMTLGNSMTPKMVSRSASLPLSIDGRDGFGRSWILSSRKRLGMSVGSICVVTVKITYLSEIVGDLVVQLRIQSEPFDRTGNSSHGLIVLGSNMLQVNRSTGNGIVQVPLFSTVRGVFRLDIAVSDCSMVTLGMRKLFINVCG